MGRARMEKTENFFSVNSICSCPDFPAESVFDRCRDVFRGFNGFLISRTKV
jgi:hypothetical protein